MTQKTITILNTYSAEQATRPSVSDLVYLVECQTFGTTHETSSENSKSFRLSTQKPKTSRGLEKTDGELGTYASKNNKYATSYHARGQWSVISVTDKPLRPHEEGEVTEKFTVKLKKI